MKARDRDYMIKAKIAIDSQHGAFTIQAGWKRPFRDMSVEDIKKNITAISQELEDALLSVSLKPPELMELKAELNTR